MEGFPGDELARLVAVYGPGLAEEPRRVRALLRDCCGEYKAEIAALSAAGEAGAGAALLHASAGVADATAERLTQTLIEDWALNDEAARWAVASWAAALGVTLTSFLSRPVPRGSTPPTAGLPPVAEPAESPATQRAAPVPDEASTVASRAQKGEATVTASGPGPAPPARLPPESGPPPTPPGRPGKRRHILRNAIVGTVVVVGGMGLASSFFADQVPGSGTTTRISPTTTIVPPTTTIVPPTTATGGTIGSQTVFGETRTLTVGVPAGWESTADDSTPSSVSITMGYDPFDLYNFGVADDRTGATFGMFSAAEQNDGTVADILDTMVTVPGCDPYFSQGVFEDGDFRYAYANAPCASGGYVEIAVLYEPQSPFYVLIYEGRAIDDVDSGRLVDAFRTIETS